MEDQQWHVHVKGRNGLRVNDRDLRRGQESVIGCGDVLEIAGTQMIFITAGDQANIHPMFLGQIDMHADDDQIAGRIADPHAHPEPVYMPSSSRSQLPAAPVTSSQTDTRAAIVPAPPNFVRPTTPTRSPRRSQHPSSAVKNSPAYARAYMVETTEQIDYSHDATKDLKPSIPYGVMITQAILSEESETMSLSGIYKWITRNFAYYRHLSTNWQVRSLLQYYCIDRQQADSSTEFNPPQPLSKCSFRESTSWTRRTRKGYEMAYQRRQAERNDRRRSKAYEEMQCEAFLCSKLTLNVKRRRNVRPLSAFRTATTPCLLQQSRKQRHHQGLLSPQPFPTSGRIPHSARIIHSLPWLPPPCSRPLSQPPFPLGRPLSPSNPPQQHQSRHHRLLPSPHLRLLRQRNNDDARASPTQSQCPAAEYDQVTNEPHGRK